LGVKSLVLEQSESLRTGGTSLTLFKNRWRVLDDIGVGTELREQFLEIQGMVIKSEDGRELCSFEFKDEAKERILLEALASQLPPNSIRYFSKLTNIERTGTSETLLELVDGTQLQAKPQYVGHSAFRDLGFYPDGQPFGPKANYVYGRGLRAGYVPVSSTKVYWFVCFNSPSPGPKITDPSVLKSEAQKLVKSWPSELLEIIDRTPDDTIIKTPLVDRWFWPKVSPSVSSGGVVLVGDAWHPMTPNLNPIVCAVRNNIVIPKLVKLGPLLAHTNFKCEPLMKTEASQISS
ncbi:hypothetical protein MKW94_019070, partial [Papaver nudicaule]|nr:hypothetical protein [Papaver nudicaule]